jgi:hypothetical protein
MPRDFGQRRIPPGSLDGVPPIVAMTTIMMVIAAAITVGPMMTAGMGPALGMAVTAEAWPT